MSGGGPEKPRYSLMLKSLLQSMVNKNLKMQQLDFNLIG